MISNEEAQKALNILSTYCSQGCLNCQYRPKNYKQVENECMFGYTPQDAEAQFLKENDLYGRKEN